MPAAWILPTMGKLSSPVLLTRHVLLISSAPSATIVMPSLGPNTVSGTFGAFCASCAASKKGCARAHKISKAMTLILMTHSLLRRDQFPQIALERCPHRPQVDGPPKLESS